MVLQKILNAVGIGKKKETILPRHFEKYMKLAMEGSLKANEVVVGNIAKKKDLIPRWQEIDKNSNLALWAQYKKQFIIMMEEEVQIGKNINRFIKTADTNVALNFIKNNQETLEKMGVSNEFNTMINLNNSSINCINQIIDSINKQYQNVIQENVNLTTFIEELKIEENMLTQLQTINTSNVQTSKSLMQKAQTMLKKAGYTIGATTLIGASNAMAFTGGISPTHTATTSALNNGGGGGIPASAPMDAGDVLEILKTPFQIVAELGKTSPELAIAVGGLFAIVPTIAIFSFLHCKYDIGYIIMDKIKAALPWK